MPDTFLEGSPGYSVAAVLRTASERLLREVVGSAAVDLLRTLDGAFADLARLREGARALVDPARLLSDTGFRSAMVGALPIAKARELAQRLAIQPGRDVYASLLACDLGKGAFREGLIDFFGVEDVWTAAGRPVSDSLVDPAYGLFDHQRQAALDVAQVLTEHPRKVLMHMPTGAGKTRTAMHIVARHINERETATVCWLAQSRELLEQAADEFESCWRHLGGRRIAVVRYWGDGTLPETLPETTFLVAGFAKLQALMARDRDAVHAIADRTTLTVVDEAHQAIAPTYRETIEILSRKRQGSALLGLSATPGRTWADVGEDAKLSAFFGERKVMLKFAGGQNPVTYLIENGYLALPNFRTLNAEPGLAMSDGDARMLAQGLDVPQAVLDGLAEDAKRNLRILCEVDVLASRHARTIVFATTVAHARLLSMVTNARGTCSLVVTGDMPQADRERAIQRFRGDDARAMVMFNFGVLTTGFDAPKTSAAIIARPTRSLVLYSQMVGRAIRGVRAGGNKEAEIVTVVDPSLAGFGDVADAFMNWEDVWHDEG